MLIDTLDTLASYDVHDGHLTGLRHCGRLAHDGPIGHGDRGGTAHDVPPQVGRAGRCAGACAPGTRQLVRLRGVPGAGVRGSGWCLAGLRSAEDGDAVCGDGRPAAGPGDDDFQGVPAGP